MNINLRMRSRNNDFELKISDLMRAGSRNRIRTWNGLICIMVAPGQRREILPLEELISWFLHLNCKHQYHDHNGSSNSR